MTFLINPKIELEVFAPTETFIIRDLFMDFEINKDLDEEPNSASVSIFNLNEGTRRKFTDRANQQAPIEIRLTPAGATELVMAFRGKVQSAKHIPTRPGYETVLECTSQQINYRAMNIDKKAFPKGTSIADVINFFIEEINLPRGNVYFLPTSGIRLGQSFSGPAFLLLKQFCLDIGMYAYILDGKIHVTSIYEPPNPTIIPLDQNIMLTRPETTARNDDRLIERKTILESVNMDPQRKQRRRRKNTKNIKVYGATDYVEYDATETLVEGMDFELMLQPDINPDTIVNPKIPGFEKRLFRVTEVKHFGNNETFEDWTTELKTDAYYDESGTLVEYL